MSLHLLIIVAALLITIVLDIYVFVRLVRLGEGFSGRVIFWGLLTLLVPVIGAIGVLAAIPRSKTSEHVGP